MKALVYYVIGGSPAYADLLRASVASLRQHNAGVDVAVLCDGDYARHVKDVGEVYFTPPNKSPVEASKRKAQAFELVDDIGEYDVVLYLDCDILVTGPLDEVFAAVTQPDKLYTCVEKGSHDHPHFGLGHAPEQLEALRRDGVNVFNCGQFAFRPTPQMEAHFDEVCRLMQEDYEGRGFWEQSHFNHHFNLARSADDTVLTPRVKLAARFPPAPPGVLLVHFSNAALRWASKLKLMRDWLNTC